MKGRTFTLGIDCPNAAEFLGSWDNDGPLMKPTPYKAGEVVRVVMVSRLGDCGISRNLNLTSYATRVPPQALVPIGEIPANICQECLLDREAHKELSCPPVRTQKR